MKNRFFALVALVLFVFSCSRFVNLGDKEKSADNTEGLPGEMSNDKNDSGDSEAAYDNWNEDNMESPSYDEGGSGEEVEGLVSVADLFDELFGLHDIAWPPFGVDAVLEGLDAGDEFLSGGSLIKEVLFLKDVRDLWVGFT